MKTAILFYTLLFAAGLNNSQAQNTWAQKAGFPAGPRWGVTSFSIGTKGYLGTGYDGINYKNDFWEYDPLLNTWTQKANFGGGARYHATGFSIGSKGYLGTGIVQTTLKKDFWEYDPVANTWAQKADFGGRARWAATGFSVENKGYVGTGRDGPGENNRNDFWEYDPLSNTWIQKANYGGGNRYLVTSFSIGDKGYAGTGWNGSAYQKDFWEFDPETNIWTQKADFGGAPREAAAGFSIGGKGYIGTGHIGGGIVKKDFWEYDPDLNIWIQKADFGGNPRYVATGLSIDGKGYIGMGYDGVIPYNDFWEYTSVIASCPIPISLNIINVTYSSAKLNWDIISGAIGYKLRYKIAGTPEWTITQSADNNKTLNGLDANTEYAWQVKSICGVSPIVPSEWSEKQFFTTDDLRLSEAIASETMEVYPNPVSQSATISFFLTEASSAVIELMDINGRSLKVIADANFSEGNHEVIFNRESLSVGMYFLQMKTNEEVAIEKITIL